MNQYRTILFLGLLVAVMAVYAWDYRKDVLERFDDYSPPSKPIIAAIDEEWDSIIVELRRKLQQRKFVELNQALEEYQANSRSDILAEERLFTAYDAFRLKDELFETIFNDWINATPDSYHPYLARAEYFYQMGWTSRGTQWASEVKSEQFVEMNRYFRKAKKDIERVIGANPQTILSYDLLIGVTDAQGRDSDTAAALQAALEISPASYEIRTHYLKSISPRWGGSFERMAVFVEKSRAHVPENPKLEMLEGLIYAEAGRIQASNDKYSVAEELYTKALAYGENHVILKARGKNSFRRENYQAALDDLHRAIELYPEDAEYYYLRSKTYARLGKHHEALSDILRSSALDPDDKYIERHRDWLAAWFTRRGYDLNKSRNPASAIEQYDAALRLVPEDASLYYRKAKVFVDLNQLDSAVGNLKKAIDLDPNDIDYYLLLDWVLAKHKDWDQIIAYWDNYIERNPDISRAYVERGGAYYHKGEIRAAVNNVKIANEMGDPEGKQAYEKFRHLVN